MYPEDSDDLGFIQAKYDHNPTWGKYGGCVGLGGQVLGCQIWAISGCPLMYQLSCGRIKIVRASGSGGWARSLLDHWVEYALLLALKNVFVGWGEW